MKMKWIIGVFVAVCVSVQAQSLVFSVAMQKNAVAIQQMVDQLPADRAAIATVSLSGTYTLDRSIVLPNYTRLDLTAARLVLEDGANADMVVNSDPTNGNHHIEVIGGILDGNKSTQSGSGKLNGLFFSRVSQLRLMDLEVANCYTDGIRLSGGGDRIYDVVVQNVRVVDNDRNGLVILWAMRNTFVNNVTATGNGTLNNDVGKYGAGVYSDHSEGQYVNIFANENAGTGIYIRNIFGGSYNNLTATRNGRYGIQVQGMVASCGSNWHAHNNSRESSGSHADLYFDADASLSYGITTNTILSNISAGPVPQYGVATEKSAVEFGPGTQSGLQISNLLEL